MSGDALPGARKAQMLLGRGLDADLTGFHAQLPRDIPAHCVSEAGQLRPLRPDRGVNVSGLPSGLPEPLSHLFQKHHARYAEITVVMVGKQLADVPQGGRAEKCIHDGVGQHICVGMAVEALFPGNFDTAQDKLSAGHKPMNVVTVSDSQSFRLPFRIRSARCRSSGVVILMFSSEPCVSCTFMPSASTAEQSSVSSSPRSTACCMAPRRRSKSNTCGVCTA